MDEIGLSPDIELSPVYDADLLGGVIVLEGEFPMRDAGEWNSLYRVAPEGQVRKIRCRLVPYYAWGNRKPSEMTVWMPRM